MSMTPDASGTGRPLDSYSNRPVTVPVVGGRRTTGRWPPVAPSTPTPSATPASRTATHPRIVFTWTSRRRSPGLSSFHLSAIVGCPVDGRGRLYRDLVFGGLLLGGA